MQFGAPQLHRPHIEHRSCIMCTKSGTNPQRKNRGKRTGVPRGGDGFKRWVGYTEDQSIEGWRGRKAGNRVSIATFITLWGLQGFAPPDLERSTQREAEGFQGQPGQGTAEHEEGECTDWVHAGTE